MTAVCCSCESVTNYRPTRSEGRTIWWCYQRLTGTGAEAVAVATPQTARTTIIQSRGTSCVTPAAPRTYPIDVGVPSFYAYFSSENALIKHVFLGLGNYCPARCDDWIWMRIVVVTFRVDWKIEVECRWTSNRKAQSECQSILRGTFAETYFGPKWIHMVIFTCLKIDRFHICRF